MSRYYNYTFNLIHVQQCIQEIIRGVVTQNLIAGLNIKI